MSLFSKLFGRSRQAPEARPEDYKGFVIFVEPIKEGGGYRVAARIEKDGKSHHLIRADVFGAYEEACEVSLIKAKLMIDQQPGALFD